MNHQAWNLFHPGFAFGTKPPFAELCKPHRSRLQQQIRRWTKLQHSGTHSNKITRRTYAYREAFAIRPIKLKTLRATPPVLNLPEQFQALSQKLLPSTISILLTYAATLLMLVLEPSRTKLLCTLRSNWHFYSLKLTFTTLVYIRSIVIQLFKVGLAFWL